MGTYVLTYRFCFVNLPFVVLQQISLCSVEDADSPGHKCGGVLAAADTSAASLYADQFDVFIIYKSRIDCWL